MSTVFDKDVLIHHIASPGLPGDGFTKAEATTLRNDLNTMLARPVISQLNDIPNVNVASPTSGQVLTWNGSAWVPGAAGGTISSVHQAWGDATKVDNVSALRPLYGIMVTEGTPGVAYIQVVYSGTGTSTSAARADHAHNTFIDRYFTFNASGTLSGGSRTLVSNTITGLDTNRTYVIKGTLYVHMRGDGTGAGFARPRVTIAGTAQDIFEDARLVAGVLVNENAPHPGVQVSGVSSVTVSASVAFQPGDPVYIGGGVLVLDIESNR